MFDLLLTLLSTLLHPLGNVGFEKAGADSSMGYSTSDGKLACLCKCLADRFFFIHSHPIPWIAFLDDQVLDSI